MAKVYFVRHQAAGILTDFPFEKPPSAAQQEALARLCFQRHGASHPKTKEPYWLQVAEVEMLNASDVPAVPERALSAASEAGTPEFTVAATGTVTPPKGSK